MSQCKTSEEAVGDDPFTHQKAVSTARLGISVLQDGEDVKLLPRLKPAGFTGSSVTPFRAS